MQLFKEKNMQLTLVTKGSGRPVAALGRAGCAEVGSERFPNVTPRFFPTFWCRTGHPKWSLVGDIPKGGEGFGVGNGASLGWSQQAEPWQGEGGEDAQKKGQKL